MTYRVLVPLRGRAADEQPLPTWNRQALSDADIQRYTDLVGARADAIFGNLKAQAASGKGFPGRRQQCRHPALSEPRLDVRRTQQGP